VQYETVIPGELKLTAVAFNAFDHTTNPWDRTGEFA
jgi:hypothetical protein